MFAASVQVMLTGQVNMTCTDAANIFLDAKLPEQFDTHATQLQKSLKDTADQKTALFEIFSKLPANTEDEVKTSREVFNKTKGKYSHASWETLLESLAKIRTNVREFTKLIKQQEKHDRDAVQAALRSKRGAPRVPLEASTEQSVHDLLCATEKELPEGHGLTNDPKEARDKLYMTKLGDAATFLEFCETDKHLGSIKACLQRHMQKERTCIRPQRFGSSTRLQVSASYGTGRLVGTSVARPFWARRTSMSSPPFDCACMLGALANGFPAP